MISYARLKRDNYTTSTFKSLRNYKRRSKGKFTSKSNSNKIKLCGGGGQHYLVLKKDLI